MTKILASAGFLLLSLYAIPSWAETCDAGHGCSITCPNGCSAIYNIDTGLCTKACAKALSAAEAERKGVNATFRDTPAADIERLLNGAK